MDGDSDDEYDKVSVPEDSSDIESETLGSTAHKTSSRSASTPAAFQTKPYCREKRLKCPYEGCDKAFNRPTRLEEHIRSHTNERPFKCPHIPCDKDYLRESHLKHHIKSAHSEVRDYKCSYEGCDKAFATGQRLRVHEATHEAPHKYRCAEYPPCNQVFRKKETLQRHINSVHEKTASFECTKLDTRTGEACKKSFDTAAKLAAHERTSHDPTRYCCEICAAYNDDLLVDPDQTASFFPGAKQAYFTTYAELQEHVALQHPPQCPICQSVFNTKKELTRHLEINHGVLDSNKKDAEQHKCTYPGCNKVYTRAGNLNVHVRSVHENRRFTCGKTEVTFDDAPPAPVTGCGRHFAHKAGLVDHIRSVHLGMDSAQTSKRKAKAEAEGPKQKRARKDKGVRKVPAISSTTIEHERFPFLDEEVDMASDDDESSVGELDGTMNMYG